MSIYDVFRFLLNESDDKRRAWKIHYQAYRRLNGSLLRYYPDHCQIPQSDKLRAKFDYPKYWID